MKIIIPTYDSTNHVLVTTGDFPLDIRLSTGAAKTDVGRSGSIQV